MNAPTAAAVPVDGEPNATRAPACLRGAEGRHEGPHCSRFPAGAAPRGNVRAGTSAIPSSSRPWRGRPGCPALAAPRVRTIRELGRRNTRDAGGKPSASPVNVSAANPNAKRTGERPRVVRPARQPARAPQIPAMPRNGAPEPSNANPGPPAPRRPAAVLPATAPREVVPRA